MEGRGAPDLHLGKDMSIARSLKADAFFYLAGTSAYALTQWLLVIVFARVAGPEGVGLFAVATAISAPIIALSRMSMRQILIADVSRRFAFADYLNARWALSIAALAAIILVSLVIEYRGVALLTILGFCLGRVIESVSDIFYARSQANDGLNRVSAYTAARGIITLIMTGGTALATDSLLAAAAAFSLASLACQLAVRMAEQRFLSAEPTGRRLSRALLQHAAPLAFAQFLIALTAYAPRLILQHFGGEQLAGQASSVEYFLAIGALGVAALGQAASSPMATAFHAGQRGGFVRIVVIIATAAGLLAVGTGFAAHLFGRLAIESLYGPAFSQAASAAPTIVTGGVVGYVASILGYAVSSTGRYNRMIGWSVAVLVTTLVGGYLMVGRLGLDGLGYALAVSGVINIVGYVHLLHRALGTLPALPERERERERALHG